MGSFVVVHVQPLEQCTVEEINICAIRPIYEEFLPDRPIESFELGIVLRCSDTTPVMPEMELRSCLLEAMVELTAVVCLDVLDRSTHVRLQLA